MITEHKSNGYKFRFNIETKSNIAIYEPNKKNAFMSILGPSKYKIYYYKLECEQWLLTKGIKKKKQYELAEAKIFLEDILQYNLIIFYSLILVRELCSLFSYIYIKYIKKLKSI